VAYRELNRSEPDCGTTFTWAARAFGPRTGWLGGWVVAAAYVIVMANLAQVAGAYTLRLFGHPAGSTFWVTALGVAWIVLMTWLSYRGVEIAARLQAALLSVEMVLLAILVNLALVKVLSGDAVGRAAAPELGWFWPGGLGLTELVDAVLIAVFLYWGWDSAVSVNEESEEPRRTPGRAAVLSTLLLMVTYVLVAFAAVAFAGIDEGGIGLANPDNADDVFATLGTAIFGDNGLGQFLATLLVFSILTSAAASTQTTVLPTARTMFAMGSHRALPARFARLHPRYRTPSYATWAFGVVSVLYYVFLTLVSSDLLADSVAATGLLIAFYYGLTGFACVWFHRRQLRGRDLWTKGVLPGLGAVMLLVVFVLSAIDYATPSDDGTSVFGIGGPFVVGIGALLLGGVVLLAYSRAAPSFFGGRALPRRIARPDVDRPAGDAVDAPAPFSDAFVPYEAVTEAIPVTVAAAMTSSAPVADGEAPKSRRPRHRLYGLADPRQFDEP
jgi:amino acid transporter